MPIFETIDCDKICAKSRMAHHLPRQADQIAQPFSSPVGRLFLPLRLCSARSAVGSLRSRGERARKQSERASCPLAIKAKKPEKAAMAGGLLCPR
jgi:hypothetical protein